MIGHEPLTADQPQHVLDVVLCHFGVAAEEESEVREVGVPIKEERVMAHPLDTGSGVGKGKIDAAEPRARRVTTKGTREIVLNVAGERHG